MGRGLRSGGLLEVVRDGVNGTLVSDGDFAGALARVPDYDPAAVAATATGFGIDESRSMIADLWSGVLERRSSV